MSLAQIQMYLMDAQELAAPPGSVTFRGDAELEAYVAKMRAEKKAEADEAG